MNNGPTKINAIFLVFNHCVRTAEVVVTDAEDICDWLALESTIKACRRLRHELL